MNSLSGRLLLATSLVLAAFIAFTALALERAFHERTQQAERDRLQGLVYGVLGAAELGSAGEITITANELPDERLRQPASGLYVIVLNAKGEIVWRSPSALAEFKEAIPEPLPAIGEWQFQHITQTARAPLFAMAFGVRWVREAAGNQRYTFVVIEDAAAAARQAQRFQHTLWIWLTALAVLLLIVQWLVLRWGLAPIKRLAVEMHDIETGGKDRIEGAYPHELRPLTESLNTLLRFERSRQTRYRNALDDLAHSLKTPLAVLRGLVDKKTLPQDETARLAEQVARMDQIVNYQLQKAATAGARALTRPVPLRPLVEQVTGSLAKVYRDKRIRYRVDLPNTLNLRADTGDLMELLGNLLDNASKWCRYEVKISSERQANRLSLLIDDDGPGVPPGQAESILQRGVRADTRLAGQGIGLAVSAEIVRAYEGELKLIHSPLGGARVMISLPLAAL